MTVRGSSASRTVETLEPTRTSTPTSPSGIDDELTDVETRIAPGADVDGPLGAGGIADRDDAGVDRA